MKESQFLNSKCAFISVSKTFLFSLIDEIIGPQTEFCLRFFNGSSLLGDNLWFLSEYRENLKWRFAMCFHCWQR